MLSTKANHGGNDLGSSNTWAHGLDNVSSFAGTTVDTSQPDNPFQTNLERSNSSNDQRHRFIGFFVYGLPACGFLSKANKRFCGEQLELVIGVHTGRLDALTQFIQCIKRVREFKQPNIGTRILIRWRHNIPRPSLFLVPRCRLQ